MHIAPDDLTSPEIRTLLETHFAAMQANSPEGSCHFLDFDGLNAPDVTFWSIWEGESLAGCGALKELSDGHGEIKSMRTHSDHLRKGVGAAMLAHIIKQAQIRGYKRLSLETGSSPAFAPALAMYHRNDFAQCPPFGDPFSIFMTRQYEQQTGLSRPASPAKTSEELTVKETIHAQTHPAAPRLIAMESGEPLYRMDENALPGKAC